MRTVPYQLVLIALFFLLPSANVAAQTNPCASDQLHDQLRKLDPVFAKRMEEAPASFQKFLDKKAAAKGGNAEKSGTATYTIPIVFHVIYTSSSAANNISDAQLQSAVQRLNEIYSNATGTTVDTKIQFQLATMDENCNATTGINRVSGASVTNYSSHGIDSEVTDTDGVGASILSIYNLSRWDPDLYMNVYVVSEIANNDGGYGTQAYAFYPSSSDSYQGVVIMYNTLGYDYNNCGCYQLKSYTNQNETLAHEVGHYFFLKHTFEGGSSSACPDTGDSAGDGVSDTPAHKYITYCPTSGNNTCYASTHAFYSWDKIKYNLMGYFTETCADEFTQGQADRMLWAIETYLPELPYSPGLQSTTATIATSASCSPQSTTGLGGEYGTGITYVKINDLEAGSGGTYSDGGYLQRKCFSTTIEPNKTYDVAVLTWGNYNEDVRAYIDYNNDGSFASTEQILAGDNGSSFTGTFTVPTTASKGVWVRARVISDHTSYTISGGCYAPIYGQVEDYPVFIKAYNPVLATTATSLTGYITHTGAASASQTFKVSATDVTSNISITSSSTAYELSTDGTTYSSSLSLTPSNLTLAETTIYVRLKTGQTAGTFAATLTISHTGATNKTVSLSGMVGTIGIERGNCLTLDGNGDYIEPGMTLPTTFTIELWLKYSTDGYIICSTTSSGSHVFNIISGKLTTGINSTITYLIDPTALTVGEWVHAAVTYDATTKAYKLYRNGMLVASKTNVTAPSSLPFYIGKYSTVGYFKGDMDEVRIWSTARTEQQIRENMHLTLLGTEANLVMYYQFNGTGTPTYDYVGGRASTLVGNASTSTASTINCGRSGTSQSISSIASIGTQNFANAKLQLVFTAKSGSESFTATYQQYKPNATVNIDGYTAFDNPVWTLNRSSTSASFVANATFTFPDNTISETSPEYYALYHRSMNEDGDWALLVAEASAVSGDAVTFNGISETGQFMVVQTGTGTERGKALWLDSNCIATPLTFNPANESFTIESWVKLGGDSEDVQFIFDKVPTDIGSHYSLLVWHGRLYVYFGNSYLGLGRLPSISYGEWHHIALSWNRTNCSLYLDGVLAWSEAPPTVPSNTAALGFGALNYSKCKLTAQIEEIRIWSTARSQQEILQNMHLSSNAKASNAAVYYQLNKAVKDVNGGNTLTVEGETVYMASSANVGASGGSASSFGVAATGEQNFGAANLSLTLTELSGSLDLTAIYQPFAPNTTAGADASAVFDDQTWTLHETAGNSFTANLTFTMPTGTFANLNASKYRLYHRSATSDGNWSLLISGAAAVTSSTVKFSGVAQGGQFMVGMD